MWYVQAIVSATGPDLYLNLWILRAPRPGSTSGIYLNMHSFHIWLALVGFRRQSNATR
jgi:hypothetical protein